jgi:hypothetical protein
LLLVVREMSLKRAKMIFKTINGKIQVFMSRNQASSILERENILLFKNISKF